MRNFLEKDTSVGYAGKIRAFYIFRDISLSNAIVNKLWQQIIINFLHLVKKI